MQHIPAEVISIGDELLYGQTLDTNSQWLSMEFAKIGSKVIQATTVGDEKEAIMDALSAAEQRATIIITTGGLGPTQDDLTKQALVRYFNSPLVLHEHALADVQNAFQRRGKVPTAADKAQAILPAHSTIIRNKLGTAPGMWWERTGKVFVALPGVPDEMKQMMMDTVLPRLKAQFDLPTIYHKTIHTIGIVESRLAEVIKPWMEALPSHTKLAYLPGLGIVKLRLTAVGTHVAQLKQDVEKQVRKLQPWAGPYIYGYDEDTLEEVVGKLLKAQGKTIALAESCSGGYVSQMITRTPGSSAYYQGGIIPYHNAAKMELLGVQATTLEHHGAVSKATAMEMAQYVRTKFKASIGLASTGIAGPGGGSDEKPVGTVWIALADGHTTHTEKLQLGSDRLYNIQLTAIYLLNLLRKVLQESSK